MLAATEAGAVIAPPVPAFYTKIGWELLGGRSGAAARLEMKRTSLVYRMKKLPITRRDALPLRALTTPLRPRAELRLAIARLTPNVPGWRRLVSGGHPSEVCHANKARLPSSIRQDPHLTRTHGKLYTCLDVKITCYGQWNGWKSGRLSWSNCTAENVLHKDTNATQ
jgi:hypothetical protein